jgi:ribosome-associated protein
MPSSPPPRPSSTQEADAIATPAARSSRGSRAGSARQFAIDLARMAAQTLCRDVLVLDLIGVSPVTDFFVIATGTSPRQMRAVCDEARELGAPRGFRALYHGGDQGPRWMLLDFFDVVLHAFDPTARLYYDLDNLWGDAPRVPWQTAELGRPNPERERRVT